MRIGNDTLGQRLAQLRKENGLTQYELAERVSTQQAVISNYENDLLRPHIEMLVELAKCFNLSLDSLLKLNDTQKSTKRGRRSKLDKQVEKIRELPRQDRDFIVNVIDIALKQRAS